MKNPKLHDTLHGVWSATPTPFTASMGLDLASIDRMVEHHVRLGVKGLFLAGTCGEGAWMTNDQRRRLVERVVKRNRGRMAVAVQVTDNSAARILDNIQQAREDGADIAVIAPPNFMTLVTPRHLLDLYQTAIRQSPLRIGIYDRGAHGAVVVPNAVLKQIYMEPNVVLVKDSSADMVRMKLALAVRAKRPALRLLTGWEFNTVPYLKNGYDGLLLGGGIFNGVLAGRIIEAVKAGEIKRADAIQARMNTMMYRVFGGKKITCWLSGQKRLLVEMGLFSTWRSYLNYPLTASCEKAIKKVFKDDRDVLLP
ncbi:MAG: dihydrodipicolinate synthase family protein [Planctomycetota bacterium]|nr:dihydrodipicolinate synthase family protein [Planctomycetota bacterium]